MNPRHKQLLESIAEQVRAFDQADKPFYIYHGSTNSTRILSFKRDEMIDVSALNRVLSVDAQRRTAITEANVPMDVLVAETLKHGLIPPVVMEFPGITVGGSIQGGAGESGSFRYGCFNRICNWYEMVLADGTVVDVSPEEDPDLYYGTAGAYGSLGIVTAAEIQLIDAKKYVQMTYLPVTSFEAAVKTLKKVTKETHDFVDGIMFGPNRGLIIVGKLSDERRGKVQRVAGARHQWFYLHADKVSQTGAELTESIPLVDYLFRYDRGAFWVGRFGFERFGVPNNRFTRWLLDPLLHTRELYKALQESGSSQEHIVQDLALPEKNAVKFMQFIDKRFDIYPLWLCPLKPDPDSPLLCNNLDTTLVINVGVWGSRIADYDEFLAANRAIEDKVHELEGKKWFYAHSYYSEDEFWSIYDKSWYDNLRAKYLATKLPSVYEKTRVKDVHKINARKGLLKTLFGLAGLKIQD